MDNSDDTPLIDDLFQKWKEFLDRGELPTADSIAGNRPDLIDSLQQRINEYFSVQADQLRDTLTASERTTAIDPPLKPIVPGLHVGRLLGRGGMGYVFEVTDDLGRPWALKAARRDKLSINGQARFFSEALTMAQLTHRYIVPVHEYRVVDGTQYIQMPIYPASLQQKLADFQKDPVRAVQMMAKVASAVGYLHENGLIHRDLKPHNILLTAKGEPALSDFGLIKDLAKSEHPHSDPHADDSGKAALDTLQTGVNRSRTAVGAVLGTPSYMAPEQAAGLTHLANPRWDVYSLGVILHELLVGKLPTSSKHPERRLNPAESDDRGPKELNPKLSRPLDQIIRKCLARQESDRFSDAREVATALQRVADAADRAKRRVRWAMASVGLLVVVTLFTFSSKLFSGGKQKERNPELALAKMLEVLDSNQEVLLCEGNVDPDYAKIVFGTADSIGSGDDSPYTVSTSGSVMVQLLPPTERAVEIRAQVRVNSGNDGWNRGGLYGGHFVASTPLGTAHTFIETSYANRVVLVAPIDPKFAQSPRVGEAATSARLIGEPPQTSISINHSGEFTPTHFFESPIPSAGNREAWHDLTLLITPEQVKAQFNERNCGQAPFSQLAENIEIASSRMFPTLVPAIRPKVGGGVGLWVHQANVSFRSIRIKYVKP